MRHRPSTCVEGHLDHAASDAAGCREEGCIAGRGHRDRGAGLDEVLHRDAQGGEHVRHEVHALGRDVPVVAVAQEGHACGLGGRRGMVGQVGRESPVHRLVKCCGDGGAVPKSDSAIHAPISGPDGDRTGPGGRGSVTRAQVTGGDGDLVTLTQN
jgi:hypothetical protein